MIIEHRSRSPAIDESATISPAATVSGEVSIGPGTAVLAGAVITSEGAPVTIGENCVIMENAVIRGAGNYPCTIGDSVLVGPNAHVSGATIRGKSFIATGSAIFNGAVIEGGSLVAINGIVHFETKGTDPMFVPMGHIAFGDPARIYSPDEAPEVHRGIEGFVNKVFGFDAPALANPDVIEELCERYTRALRRHADDKIIKE